MTPDGARVAVAAGNQIWSYALNPDNCMLREECILDGDGGLITGLAVGRDCRTLASTTASGKSLQMYIATPKLMAATVRKTCGTVKSIASIAEAASEETTMKAAFRTLLAATTRARCSVALKCCIMA